MRKTIVLGLSAALVCASGAWAVESSAPLSKNYQSAVNGAPEAIVHDAASAMEYFRQTAANKGQWKVTAIEGWGGKEVKSDSPEANSPTTYRLFAAGSVVEQTYYAGTPNEMTIDIHQDGPDKLLYTHYCSARNVPTTAFHKSSKPGEMIFKLVSVANANLDTDNYFTDTTIHVLNNDSYEQEVHVHVKGGEKIYFLRWTRIPTTETAASH